MQRTQHIRWSDKSVSTTWIESEEIKERAEYSTVLNRDSELSIGKM